MQSFRYSLPTSKRPSRRPRGPWRAIAVALGLLGVGAAVWSGLPASGAPTSLAAWLTRPAAEQDHRAEAMVKEAEAHLRSGQFAQAASLFDQAIGLGAPAGTYRRALDARYLLSAQLGEAPPPPEDQAATLARAAYELAGGRPAAALRAYDEALATDATNVLAHVGRGQALLKLGRMDDAVLALSEAHRLAPDEAAVTEAWVAVRVSAGDGRRALTDATEAYRALAGRTDDEAVHINLLDAYMRQGLTMAELRTRHVADAPGLSAVARDTYLAEAAMRHFKRNPHWHQQAFDDTVDAGRRVLATRTPEASAWRARAGRLLAEAYAARAQRFFERSDFDAARVQWVKALTYGRYMAPHDRADVHVQLARLLPLLGHPESAAAELESALAIDPTHPCREELSRWSGHLGLGLLAAGRAKEAVKPLQRALAVSPQSPIAMARLHQALSRTGHASPLTAAAHAAGLPLLSARVKLAEGLLAIGRKDEAARAATAAAKAGAAPAALAGLRAELALAHGQRHQARQALLAAVEHRPAPELWLRLAEVDAALAAQATPAARPSLWARASDDLRHALVLAPSDAIRGRLLSLHKSIALAALARRDWASARREAGAGLTLAPGNPALSLPLGDALVALQRPDEARAAYQAGLSGLSQPDAPASGGLHGRLGQVLLAEKRHEEAIATLRSGLTPEVAASPADCADLYYTLTLALWESGKREEAIESAHQYLLWSFHDPEEARRVPQIQKLESQLATS